MVEPNVQDALSLRIFQRLTNQYAFKSEPGGLSQIGSLGREVPKILGGTKCASLST